MRPKQELVRIVRSKEGNIDTDLNGKKPGRGAYICYAQDCLDNLKNSNVLASTFKQRIDERIYEQIQKLLNEGDINI